MIRRGPETGRLGKWTWFRRLALGSTLVGAGILGSRVRRRQRKHRVTSTAIGDAVTIQRSNYGVPRIVAASRNDGLFGLGYAIADDRLWQMDILRRTATGKLSEIAGPDAVASDQMMRALGMVRIAHALVRDMDEDTLAAAEAFAAGVNQRIESGTLPLEFRFSGLDPEPWTPADSVAIFRLLGWTLGSSLDADITANQLYRVIDNDWIDAIYNGSFPESPPIIREFSGQVTGAPEPADRLPIFPDWGASNAWAVAGERSATGAPLLANDPHLELQNPSVWYEASIDAPGFHVAGLTMPGIPAVVIGRTPSFAWGVTAAMVSQTFLYRERINADKQCYAERDEWLPVEFHYETIPVRGQPANHFRIRQTVRGPIVSDFLPGFAVAETVSLHWTGVETSQEFAALLAANACSSIDDVRPHLEPFAVPALNVVAADAGGNIGLVSLGRLAIRESKPGFLHPMEFPPAYIKPDDMPVEMNPERGWVAAANNQMVAGEYPYQIHGYWAPGFRYRRIVDDLESRPVHSHADFRTLQRDTYSLHAAGIVPVLLEVLDSHVPEWLRAELRAWDFETDLDSRATLVFETFYQEWTQLVLEHRLPADVVRQMIDQSGALAVPVLFVDRLLRGELPDWFSDRSDRKKLVKSAMAQALVWLENHLGADRDSWTWGAVHRLTMKHPLGRIQGPHRYRLNVGPFPMPGTQYTVSPGVWRTGKSFDIYAGPSMRFVTDMRRPLESWITIPLGQSGSPFSRQFRDQTSDYLQGFLHRLWPDGSKSGSPTIIRAP